MRASPPPELIELLDGLGLASPTEVQGVRRIARWLARDHLQLASVWVDALVHARRLTPFQAGEINAGRGAELRVGPYVLIEPLDPPGGRRSFRAREETAPASQSAEKARPQRKNREVRLLVLPRTAQHEAMLAAIKDALQLRAACQVPQLVPIVSCGADPTRLWVACRSVIGRTAAQWVAPGGRLPPLAVLEIARQMAAGLAACDRAALVHGNLSARHVVLDPVGLVQLLWPGVPSASLENAPEPSDLAPENLDYLAPELAASRGQPGAASDTFACGALWWHLLAGRPPFAANTVEAKRRAAIATRVRDIRPIEPDTPPALADAIAACTEVDPAHRPDPAALVELLGAPTERGQALLAQYLSQGATPNQRIVRRVRTIRRSANTPTWVAVAGGAAFALALATWPLWSSRWLAVEDAPVMNEPPAVTSHPAEAPLKVRENTPIPRPPAPAADSPGKLLAKSQRATTMPSPSPLKTTANTRSDANHPSSVVPASAVQTLPAEAGARRAVSREFLLPGGQPVAWASIRPESGQTVRGRRGERPLIVLPADGGVLASQNVRFENVDFLAPTSSAPNRAMLSIAATQASFHGCSFQSTAGQPLTDSPKNLRTAAIHWSPSAAGRGDDRASSAALNFSECVFSGVDPAVRCTDGLSARLSFSHVLHVGPGPLVDVVCRALSRPSSAQPLDVRLSRCTLRDAECIVKLSSPPGASDAGGIAPTGSIRLDVRHCVLAPGARGAVLVVAGAEQPLAMLGRVAWSGEESFIVPDVPWVVAANSRGQRQPISGPAAGLSGLVRSELGFGGTTSDGPNASRLVRWQVPLRSTQPPGVGEWTFVLPRP